MIYDVIEKVAEKAVVSRLCEHLGVSRAGFYASRQRARRDSRHDLVVADNVLARQFLPEVPDQAWVCDITYIRTRSGWLYLGAVRDL